MTKQTTKRGPLSEEERSYIDKNKSKTVAFLAKKLNRGEKSISQYLSKMENVEENSQNAEPETPANTPESFAMSLMAKNEKYGAVIMTQNASMLSDDSRKARVEKGRNPVSSRYKTSIHIINPNKPIR